MRGGSADSPSMVTVPASASLNQIMMGDDSMSDDVFEVDDDKSAINYNLASTSSMSYLPPASPVPYVLQHQHGNYHSLASERLAQAVLPTPSPTGYRDYTPPAEVLEQSNFSKSRLTDNIWSSYKRDDNPENAVHKTILLGDSGVGKTSLLVQFDLGKFQHGNFAATVGIGFTVMLLGDSGVGKTCILTRFRDGQFLSGNYITTVGIDFRNKMVTVDDTQVKLQIWDTAGQERFRSVTHAYYRDAHALLLLYDVTNKQSYDNIRAWLGEIREYAQDNVVIMLLGNKCDCGPERVVRREDGQRLASEYKVPFMETSAKTGLNVELAFHAVARELKARAKKEEGDQDEARFNVQDYLRQQQSQRSSCLNSNCLTT